MKTILTGLAAFLAASLSLQAQDNNLVLNGSFETTSGVLHGRGGFSKADSISSPNNTSVDLYSRNASGSDYDVPANYMGNQESTAGGNYAGIIAYYADDAGIFKTKPGYQKYSEYIQLALREPLVAGKAYTVSFTLSLAERSAYAVSGFGVYFSATKMDVKNNAFLALMPHIVSMDILTNTEWTTFTGVYVAAGGERYMELGCFDMYMETKKIVAPGANNSRKAYYYIDNVSMTPQLVVPEDITMVLSGNCFRLNNLEFETDQSVILPGSFEEMNLLSRFLKTYPHLVVYIDGHTDKTGTETHNEKLSADRALAVRTYLVKSGVAENRLKLRSFGESQPIDTQNENSLINRRVEITICAATAARL